ncbi:DUF1365 domain-containing protein [Bowmanella yangjiangensis]|uniref:DUF1365 domain-containing protein n=1 Tax=Bowmanella yangjiangensis TaxID=2811230 RepID=A0ABS3CY32_9ALTE|nr:DUF1365 domain-containing protein [Bowmanella yangjiangensis]MBN7822035.1 DUF1365 domain-containing protein [Bowmanella yangjiangensis]
MSHRLYTGLVWHKRHRPVAHQFSYGLKLFWLDLQKLEQLEGYWGISSKRWSVLRFKRQDYLTQPHRCLAEVAKQKMSELAGNSLNGDVYLLAPLRWFGFYFSPVNFYYLRQADGKFSHVLAEVSNTPWNERHCYLVDLQHQQETEKAFHVSPFNPIAMRYQWQFNQPSDVVRVKIGCATTQTDFEAGIQMREKKMNRRALLNVMLSTMTFKTLVAIYWQAIKIFLKGNPVYDHTSSHKES